MTVDQLKVLIIEDDPGDVEIVRETLADSAGHPILLEAADTLKSGFERLSQGAVDLVLLDLGLPDSQGLSTVSKTYSRYPEIPIVVLTGYEDETLGEQTLKSGAQDYLSKDRIDRQVLVRSIRYAVERSRLVRELEQSRERDRRKREVSALDEFQMNPAASVVAEMYDDGKLLDYSPQLFNEFVTRYSRVLDLAVEETVFKRDRGTSKEVEAMAAELGRLRCRPNDLVDLHRTALERVCADQHLKKVQAYTEEGRILFVGLIGHLAAFYRRYYVTTFARP